MKKLLLVLVICAAFLGCTPADEEAPVTPEVEEVK